MSYQAELLEALKARRRTSDLTYGCNKTVITLIIMNN